MEDGKHQELGVVPDPCWCLWVGVLKNYKQYIQRRVHSLTMSISIEEDRLVGAYESDVLDRPKSGFWCTSDSNYSLVLVPSCQVGLPEQPDLPTHVLQQTVGPKSHSVM